MNVLFLGDGFDLFHKLPTKYINFLNSYDERDESSHITNLINIFGKSDFDKMRREKDISFLSISDDIKVIMRENSEVEKLKKWADAISSVRTII